MGFVGLSEAQNWGRVANRENFPETQAFDSWLELTAALHREKGIKGDKNLSEIKSCVLRGARALPHCERDVRDSNVAHNLQFLSTKFIEESGSGLVVNDQKFGEWARKIKADHRAPKVVTEITEMELDLLLVVSLGERAGKRGKRLGIDSVLVNVALEKKPYPYTAAVTLEKLRGAGYLMFESPRELKSPYPRLYLTTEKGQSLLRRYHGEMGGLLTA